MGTYSNRVRALAQLLECKPSEVSVSDYTEFDRKVYEVGNERYLVLSDNEATKTALEAADGDLWAFNTDFILGYIDSAKNLGDTSRGALEKTIQQAQQTLCEDADAIIRALIGSNLKKMLADAIRYDGRAHFLDGYDGEEDEETVNGTTFYIFQR